LLTKSASGFETDQEVTMQLVWEELDALCTRNKITKWAMRPVTKKYAFGM
jgi:hypothetical protein